MFQHSFNRILFILAFLTAGLKLNAQTYPVQVAVTAVSPYQNYFSSYANDDRLKVTLIFTDFASPPIQVRLKLHFDSPTFDFESNPINQPVITLDPGIPHTLTTEELQIYFQNQLPADGPQNGLTEGPSSFCIEVRAVSNNELLNNTSCGYFNLTYGQPALLTEPTCGSIIPFSVSQSTVADPIIFSFNPPTAPIGLQMDVVNTFHLYNYSDGLTAQNLQQPLSLVSALIFPGTIDPGSAQYILLPTLNNLVRGNKYVWYIHSSIPGQVNQFQNNGWSSPCIFTYDEADSYTDGLIDGLTLEWLDAEGNDPNPGFYPGGESKANAKWKVVAEEGTQAISFSEYIFSYRKKVLAGEEEFDWFHDTVTQLSTAIYQLEPATTYEAYVRGRLGSSETDPTDIREITTDSARTYACGVRDLPGRMTVFNPLMYADPGTKVQIGQFELEMVDVQPTGEAGHFAGTGLVAIDFLMGAEAKVRFNDLKIDKEYVVWDGTADVITQGLDAWLQEQYQQFQDPIWVNGTIDSAYVSDSLAHIVLNGVDTTFEFPCPTCPVIINDAAGNQVTIYPNGTVVWSTYLDISDEQLDVPDTEIALFEEHPEETGGFDPYEHTQWHDNYEIIRTSNSVNYFVPNKSVKEGQTDKVNVSVPKNEYEIGDVQLNWESRTAPLDPVSSTESGAHLIFTFELPVLDEDEVAIYAVSDGLKIGKMNVVRYELMEKNVVVVPVGGNTVNENDIATYLNQSLGEAGLNFTVTVSDTIGISQYANTTFNVPDATLMTKYGPDMRALRDNYFNGRDTEDDTYYLFVVAELQDIVNNESVDGYMVRGKSIGFISTSAVIHTIAHELSHGIGALEHSWKNNGPTKNSTDNMMDYAAGTNLLKTQWESLREPKGGSFWDEEEDALASKGLIAYYVWEETDNNYTGEPIHSRMKEDRLIIVGSRSVDAELTDETKNFYNSVSADKMKELIDNNITRFETHAATKLKSIAFYRQGTGAWKTYDHAPVMYFELKKLSTGGYKRTFLFSDDKIKLSHLNKEFPAHSHYIVKVFKNTNGSFDHYEIFDLAGNNITSQFLSSSKNPPKRYLVFSNGYRGPLENWNESDGMVTTNDRFGYWGSIDNSFMSADKLDIKTAYYIDGSFRIWTSNHINFAGFAGSMSGLSDQYKSDNVTNLEHGVKLEGPKTPYLSFSFLNTKPNIDGFNYRKYMGTLAGKAFLAEIKKDPRSVGVKDTVDIVAHSMGYAYAVGFVEAIKSDVHFGRFYIIAPENACSGGNDWTMFEEVWQYGSNNNPSDEGLAGATTTYNTRDPYWWQDGVAPQCAVKNIEPLPSGVIGGRAYIPKTSQKHGFVDSHSITNYTWIFNLESQQNGYVKKR